MFLPAAGGPICPLMIGLTRKEMIPPQPLAAGADQALSTSSLPLRRRIRRFFEEFDFARFAGDRFVRRRRAGFARGQFHLIGEPLEPT